MENENTENQWTTSLTASKKGWTIFTVSMLLTAGACWYIKRYVH